MLSGGAVTELAGSSFTNALGVDFGYRYTGTNVLSGTVGLDAPTPDADATAEPDPAGDGAEPPDGVAAKAVIDHVAEKHGILITGAQGAHKGRFLRIGHLGTINTHQVERVLTALVDAVTTLGSAATDCGRPRAGRKL